jgi:leader peptidase (prepilin peptidase)/N-methyltransferase
MSEWILLIAVCVLGSIIGSFLNVCIVRIPKSMSIVMPASHCPACHKPIRFYDNIPLLSYILLKGTCRFCKAPISFRYFLVELLTPLLLLLFYARYGLSVSLACAFIFAAALIVITFIDLAHQIIPDVISLPGIPLFFICSFFVPWVSPAQSFWGILTGGGILYAFAAGYKLLAKKEGMGGGDIKLLAMIGAFLGWQGALVALVLAACAGSIIGIIMIIYKGKNLKYAIPFGPFLALGALCALLFGQELIILYLNMGR